MSEGPSLYGGWFVVDVRLLLFVIGMSVLTTTSMLALFVRKRHWQEYVTMGINLFIFFGLLYTMLMDIFFYHPVIRLDSFFPLP